MYSAGTFRLTYLFTCHSLPLQPTKDRCLKEGFADFLSKPLIISDLAKLLIRAYEEKQTKAEAGQG